MANLLSSSNVSRLKAPHYQSVAQARDAHSLRRILVCVDHSPFSEVGLRYAVAISKSLGGAITLLHVMQPADHRSEPQTTNVLDWEISRQAASAYLERLATEGTKALGRQVETRLEQGQPVERITTVARELDAGLTVLGSQGEEGAAGRNLGSTVLQVLAVTRGSVLIARSSSAVDGDFAPKRILVPLDGSVRAESVLPTAVRIASAHNAELLLVFVVREPGPTAVQTPEDLEVARELAKRLEVSGKRYLEGLCEQVMREGVSARSVVLRNVDERQSLLELSQKERTDLIVLSAHGSTCNSALVFGGVTAHLLTHSVVSLLVLQDLRDSELRGPELGGPPPPPRASYPEGAGPRRQEP